MYEEKSFLAVIPARKGSKRLIGKNLLPLSGKPLITWSIEAAQKSKYIDKLLVSSDDDKILELAKNKGIATVLRPDHLASDKASTVDALLHAIDSMDTKYDYVVLLQVTSPLRTTEHIDEAIEKIIEENLESVVSVCEVDHSPLWSNVLPDDGRMKDFIPEGFEGKRSQDLEKYYRLNGAIYIININKLISSHSLLLAETFAYIMPIEASVDIDTIYDFIYAEAIIKHESNLMVKSK